MEKSRQAIKNETVKAMKALGTYKAQYNQIIDVYADTLHQYERALEDFKRSGYEYQTETAAGNPKKSSLLAAVENLRKDILIYSDRLCLNPRALENITTVKKETSTLATALKEISDRR